MKKEGRGGGDRFGGFGFVSSIWNFSLSFVFAVGACNFAKGQQSGPLTYEIVGETVKITDCQDDVPGIVTIPSTIEELPVTNIEGGAFAYCGMLTEVVIPESVAYIGGGAFLRCYALEEVLLPHDLETFGSWVFEHCNALHTIRLPDSLDVVPYGIYASSAKSVGETLWL